MKQWIFIMLSIWTAVAVHAQSPDFSLQGIGSANVPATIGKMTNLIFPEAIQTAVKVSRDVLAQKVRGVNNVLELKANREGFAETNLTVYSLDGRIYSFVVHFSVDSSVLNFRVLPGSYSTGSVNPGGPIELTSLPSDIITLREEARRLSLLHPFLHISAKAEKIKAVATGIYLSDSLQWFTLRLFNGSRIPFQPGFVRYYMVDKKVVKRKATQDQALEPVFTDVPESVPGRSERRFAVGFSPFTVPSTKRLVIQISGVDGGRTVTLKVKSKQILKAK